MAEALWTPGELDRRRLVEAGGTVVAYPTHDRALVSWARGPDAPPIKQDREWRRGLEVYIGRAVQFQRLITSPWHNPSRLPKDATPEQRAEVIRRYRAYVLASPTLMARLPELRGKVLTCWCHPLPCHGDVLIELLAGLSPDAGPA
jgi:hypothetical protein